MTVAQDAHWRALLLHSADAAIICDPLRRAVTFMSPAATRLFGWRAEDVLGSDGFDFVHPDDRDDVRRAVDALADAEEPSTTVEFRLRCPDGSLRWAEATIAAPVIDGVAPGLVVNVRDVTQRRETLRQLYRREQLMKTLAARTTDLALLLDQDGRIVYCNNETSPLYAAGPGVAPRSRLSHVHPHDRAGLEAALRKMDGPGSVARVTYRRLTRDGSWRWVEQTLTNCLEDPEIQGYIAHLRDIHEHVEAQRALLGSEARYRTIVETAMEGIVQIDGDGRIAFANQKLADLYGAPLQDVIGLPVEVMHRPAPPEEVAAGRRLLAEHGTRCFDLPFVRADGQELIVQVSASPLFDDGGYAGALAMISDVTQARTAQASLRHRALHDPLTGLGNRTLLAERLDAMAGAGGAAPGRSDACYSLLLADIDQFKMINDTMGHASGDELLVAVAKRWQAALRPDDLLIRLGGDEFVVVANGCDALDAGPIADRLHRALEEPIEIRGRAIGVRASIGIASQDPADPCDADTLIGRADAAMYEAKRCGRGRNAVFTGELIERAETWLRLTTDLKAAVDSERLALHYQPIVDLATGRLLGLEALSRWVDPDRGVVPPDEFIPAAEQSGLIGRLDRWALQRACRDAARLRAAGLLPADAYVAVNCSAHTLAQPGYEQTLQEALEANGLPAQCLVLEVTESTVMHDPGLSQRLFVELRELGVRVAIDDFGTGYSSLAYLRQFSVAILKVDRSFVTGITTSHGDLSIVSTIVDLARALGVTTVCEGIETPEELALLSGIGCGAGQGWLWSPALGYDDLAARLADPAGFVTRASALS